MRETASAERVLTDNARFSIRSEAGPDQQILTKGDNNDSDDIALYGGPKWLRRKQIVGKVSG